MPGRLALPLALCLVLGTPALAPAHGDHDHDEGAHGGEAEARDHGEVAAAGGADDHDDHVSEGAGVRIVHGWTRATAADTALVFGEIENVSDAPVTLSGATSEAAGNAVLVGFRVSEGELGYVPLPALPLSAGREMELAPNGIAIRLEGLRSDLAEGEAIEVTFEFDTGAVPVTVAVEGADARQHGHAGHQH